MQELIRGDSCVIEFSIEEEISMEDIEAITLTARTYAEGTTLFTKNKEDFMLENKIFSVEIKPEDTQELKTKKFGFDIEIVLKDGTTTSIIDTLELVPDYTHHRKSDENGN